MMFFKRLITPNTLSKIIKKPSAFKQMDWSLVKKNEYDQLSRPVQTIVKELENTSSTDAQGPTLKNY
ncbi:hypothetical protein Lgra_1954 [Legionella gratiana]|uniref:Uncharacterized protein n=1 Tax=Legionella gratiana TaxID=45066 RepID=A0A378JB27_9GAMM|nr:hypothetical protein [Legionella gratiana]KTD10988.1 hypothetical protein Lgra_1954 [Legionella gratiana]STX44669.1 Uncharacterised protein [Legionella gratiana]